MCRVRILSLFMMVLLLSACGGGGGGSQIPQIEGSVLAVSNTDIDSDVNDTASEFAENDSFASAQILANFATVGGYLNRPGIGAFGRSFVSGDIEDFYEIDLLEGQSITLIIAEQTTPNLPIVNNDIDLTLFDANQMVVDQSMNNDVGECVENITAGKHFIRASILTGGTNYTLSITSLPCSAAFTSTQLRLGSDFQPLEFVATMHDMNMATAMSSELDEMAMDMQIMPHQKYAKIKMRDMSAVSQAMGLVQSADQYASALVAEKAMTLKVIKELQQHAEFKYVEPNFMYQRFASTNDPFFSRQWHFPLISLPQAWDQAIGGSGAIVAVLDTGVLTSHPDLIGNLLPGFDFISDPLIANDGNGIDADPNDPGDSLINEDGFSSFHGTHVLGTVGAVANNNEGVSGAGFFSNIQVMPLRVLGVGGGTLSDICEALFYAARLDNASNTLPAVAADVVNMSLGAGTTTQMFQDCITTVRDAGLIIVAAAGNFSSSAPSFPAAHDGVVSVSAATLTRNLASYSNFGSTIDVAAPGGDATDDDGDGLIDGVFSTIGNEDSNGNVENTFGYLVGTSMATPHVSAVAALMKSVTPSLTPDQFDAFLAAGELTDDLGAPGRDDSFGFGLINANKAVLRAQGLTPTVPILSAAPSGANFGLSETEVAINISNVGGGDLTINSFSENSGGWLTIVPPNGGGEGIYRLIADRNSALLASPGTFTATVSFASNGNDIDLPILLQVAQLGQSSSANAGTQFILLSSLTNPDNDQFVALQANDGRYDFVFNDVAEDVYLILSGTDNDNDFTICDEGEACGLLGTFDEPFLVEFSGSGSIDVGEFFTSFNFGASVASSSVPPIRVNRVRRLPGK